MHTGSNIFASQFADPALTAIYADDAWLSTLVRVEVALTQAQAKCGLMPATAAAAISAAAATFVPDKDQLAAATAEDGFPIIKLVAQLRAHVGGDAARFVHWGATTQDIMDTAAVLQARAALSVLRSQHTRVITALAALVRRERDTLCVGRTHLQPALPITFGLKVAHWLAPLLRHARRLDEFAPRLGVIQLGGATGTLASHGAAGPSVQAAFANNLDLTVPPAPWHAERDVMLELAGILSLVTGSLAKIGTDFILLNQAEVGELTEYAKPGGGSSAMPHKRNPVAAERLLVAARTNAALLGLLHTAAPQEHERGTHGWQIEMLHLPQIIALTGGALATAETLVAGLIVDRDQMLANLAATRGLLLSEAVTLELASHVGADEARRLVRSASSETASAHVHLIDALRRLTSAPLDWDYFRDESRHLGATQIFIDRVLAETATLTPR